MSGRCAIGTAGSHGIGREIPFVLVERGFTVRSIGMGPQGIETAHRETRERKRRVSYWPALVA